MPLREYAGAAPATRLAGALAVGTTTSFSVITSGGAGYPSGATAPFVVVIDRGTSLEEKILVATRAGDIFSTLTRGYDGTTAQAHAGQAVVEHVMDAASIQESNAHVNTTARDDHTQYLNVARHDITARHSTAVVDMVGIAAALIPSGTMWMTANASAPTGWLICDGSAVSRTTYAALYSALGSGSSPYGQGDGVNTFNLPDMRGRVPVGVGTGAGGGASGTGAPTGGSALTALARGSWKGEELHTLTGGETGAHSHTTTESAHNHTQNGHGHSASDPGHGHGVTDPQHHHTVSGGDGGAVVGYKNAGAANGTTSSPVERMTFTTIDFNPTGISINSGGTGVSVVSTTATNVANSTGLSVNATAAASGHNNIQPQLCVNFMIKT